MSSAEAGGLARAAGEPAEGSNGSERSKRAEGSAVGAAGPADPAQQSNTAAGQASGGKSRGHLYQIDLFRLLTFASVILVHVVSGSFLIPEWPSQAVQTMLHFTRQAFFALTGFVLAYQALRRPLPATRFWRKRFPLVAVPYVVWTIVYWAMATWVNRHEATPWEALTGLVTGLITGSGWYHLYFLLVTLQVYLVFPLLIRLLRATYGKHRWVLAVSLLVQLVVSTLAVTKPFTSEWALAIWDKVDITLLGYQLYTVVGAVAALHFDAVHAWVRRHGLLVFAAFVLGVGIAQSFYWIQVGYRGAAPVPTSSVFQPAVIPYFLAIITALYALGSWWAARRVPGGWGSRVIDYASDRSFAIFLCHPLVLAALMRPFRTLAEVSGWLPAVVLLYVATVAGTVVLADLLRRIPGSKALTGRPRIALSTGSRRATTTSSGGKG